MLFPIMSNLQTHYHIKLDFQNLHQHTGGNWLIYGTEHHKDNKNKNASKGVTYMVTSSNGNIFRVTGHLCGNSPVAVEFPAQRPVTRSFDVLFDLRLNKRLSKQSWGWWFETPSRPLWRHCNGTMGVHDSCSNLGAKHLSKPVVPNMPRCRGERWDEWLMNPLS